MPKHIVIIDGNPDPDRARFGHALADAYAEGAQSAGHEVRRVEVATLDFPLLRSKQDWDSGTPPPAIRESQETTAWADHMLIIFPLWMGDMPALLKAFIEQCFRPGFALQTGKRGLAPGQLKGKTAHIVITMGMPSVVYRWYFGAHGLKNLRRGMLKLVGIRPTADTLIGMVEGKPARREKWLAALRQMGRDAA